MGWREDQLACCMEVAVAASGSFKTRGFRGVLALGACVLSFGLAGCGTDLITYAGESRQRGIELYNQGSFADAAGSFSNAIRQDPRDYQSHYYLGRSYESLDQQHQAVHSYRTALNVMEQSLVGREDIAFRQKVLDGLASAAAKGNSPELNRASLKSAEKPTAEDHFILAKIYRIHGDADSAVDEYGSASQGDPGSLPIAREFGLYLAQLGQQRRAAQQLSRAYALNRKAGKQEDPDVVSALRAVGVIPGPSLVDEQDLAKPAIPYGPLPAAEDLAKLRLQNPVTSEQSDSASVKE
jgi:Tfp pilus assembly protein PilF